MIEQLTNSYTAIDGRCSLAVSANSKCRKWLTATWKQVVWHWRHPLLARPVRQELDISASNQHNFGYPLSSNFLIVCGRDWGMKLRLGTRLICAHNQKGVKTCTWGHIQACTHCEQWNTMEGRLSHWAGGPHQEHHEHPLTMGQQAYSVSQLNKADNSMFTKSIH